MALTVKEEDIRKLNAKTPDGRRPLRTRPKPTPEDPQTTALKKNMELAEKVIKVSHDAVQQIRSVVESCLKELAKQGVQVKDDKPKSLSLSFERDSKGFIKSPVEIKSK